MTRTSALPAPDDLAQQLPPGLHTRTLQRVQVRADDAPAGTVGTFEGYACIWDVVDSYGTTFRRGCFSAGGLDEDPYPLLWMHSPYTVLGSFTGREDDTGLLIRGAWDDTVEGRDARTRAASGSAPELSVGFSDLLFGDDAQTQIIAVRLMETSQVTRRMASVPGATLTSVRRQAAQQQLPDAVALALHQARGRLALARLAQQVGDASR